MRGAWGDVCKIGFALVAHSLETVLSSRFRVLKVFHIAAYLILCEGREPKEL